MTYRQFLKSYRKKRENDTPDVQITAKPVLHKTNWKKIGIPLSAAVAAVLVISATFLLRRLPSKPTDVPMTDIQVSAVSYRTLQADAPLLPQKVKIERYIGARMVAVTADEPFVGHETCTSVFYQLDEKHVFCVDHYVLGALSAQNVSASAVKIHFYDPVREVVIFTTSDTRHSYWLDMATDTLRQLSASLYHCPSRINSADQAPYALLHSMGGGHDDLFLIDAATGNLTNIVKDKNGNYLFDPMEDEKLIADNAYVLYTHGTGDGTVVTSPARTSVLYHIETGNSYTFTGQVEAELSDQLLIQTPDGYKVYNLTDHTVTPLENAALPTQYHYQLRQTDLYSRYSYRLELYNRLTGEKALLCDDYLVAHLVSPDHRYVYYYVRGENVIRVYDLSNSAQSTLPLSADVTAETETGEAKDKTVFYSLWMDETGSEIVLTYQYSAHPREDPEAIRLKQENDPSYLLDALIHDPDRGFTSIASLEPILKRFPELVTAYQGVGYVYLDYTPLRFYGAPNTSHALQIALEDYASATFYDLDHINQSIDSQFTVTNQHILTSNAEQETLRMLKACNVTILPAAKDYRPYFTDQSVNRLKLCIEHAASEHVLPRIRGYYVRKAYGYEGAMMGLEAPEELAILREFLVFSDTLSYNEYVADDTRYWEDHTYLVQCYGTALPFDGILFIGKHNGRPFLMRNGCLAYITAEDYQYWCDVLARQEPKSHID